MVYMGRYQKLPLILLLAIMSPTYFFVSNGFLLAIQCGFSIFILLAIFIRYTLQIEKDELIFQTCFLSFSIYQKYIKKNHIVKMKFERFGWSKKGVIIKRKKGVNIRIVDFTPKTAFQELHHFASKNHIPFVETKDFKRL
ncbi:hypothetical protein ACQKL5_13930 [Peribacillus sp. NPDC097675]|uniref:hypothetical protein n=1 Tax=Peribacillus sp. NPDC097675 TaxID=3390618 RepID=UPI003D01D31B